jgi:FAD/FMN-containing dehydrogenase
LAQNGGHGWQSAWKLGSSGVLINLRGLNFTTFSSDKTQVTIGGGAIVKEVIDTAFANDVQVLTGNCNCVGVLGAALGGGYGNLMGLYGFSIDNIISMNVILADGSAHTVTKAQADLFWALRGAGPNFGIVTSAVMVSHPMPKEQNVAWTGGLFFTPDKIEQVVQAIENLDLQPRMNVFLYFLTSGPPDFTPTVLVTPFYVGTEAEGRAAFKSLLDINPYQDTTALLHQNEWNTGADGFCVKGGRKPTFTAGLMHMVPKTWKAIWDEFTSFLANNPGTGFTTILVECYSLDKAQSIPSDSASFANRDIRFNSAVISWYDDPAIDVNALKFGSKVRDLWRSTSGLPFPRV